MIEKMCVIFSDFLVKYLDYVHEKIMCIEYIPFFVLF
jgi:hypothetical protein